MRILFTAILTLIAVGLQAQEYVLSRSTSITKYSGGFEIKNLLGVNREANEAYVIYDASTKMLVDTDAMTYGVRFAAIDLTSMEIKRETIVHYSTKSVWNVTNRDEPKYWMARMIGDQIVVFQYDYDVKSKIVEYFGRVIDPTKMEVVAVKSLGAVDLSDWKSMKRGSPAKANFKDLGDVSVSPDEQRLLFTFRIPFSKKDEKVSTYVALFDEQLDPLLSKVVEFPLKKSQFSRVRNYVDNEGRVFLTGYRKFKEDKKPSCPMFFVLKQGEGALQYYETALPHYTRNFFLVFHNGRTTLLGLYTPIGSKGSHGNYFVQPNLEAGTLGEVTIEPFDRELLHRVNNGYENYDWSEKKLGIPFLKLQQVNLLSDEGFSLVLEYQTEQRGSEDLGQGVSNSYKKHRMRDLFIMEFKSDGSREGIARLHKNQFGYSGRANDNVDSKKLMSGFAFKQNGNWNVFYNESSKNLEQTDQEKRGEYNVSGNLVDGQTQIARAVLPFENDQSSVQPIAGLPSKMWIYPHFRNAAQDGVFLLLENYEKQYFMVLE